MAGSPHILRLALFVAVGGIPPSAALAETIPFADTEDATLSEVEVGSGQVHPVLTFDLRNGDYARGAYDDDGAGLGRVPAHVSIGGAVVLQHGAGGTPALLLIGQSSNGFHAPGDDERASPRGWYESNTLVGIAWRPSTGLSTAATYTIKASPNGVAATTHEASLTLLYSGVRGPGMLKPRLAVTRRTKGAGGIYTIAGVSPEWALTAREDGPSLALPLLAGIGWSGFYGKGSGDRAYASGGLALALPMRIGTARSVIQFEVLALVRDDGLRRLDAPNGTTARVVPYATVSASTAW